jgi:hypothetical protein
MPKVTFSEHDRARAAETPAVMFSFAVDARYCPDFPDKRCDYGGVMPPDRAAGLLDVVRDYLKRTKPETTPA